MKKKSDVAGRKAIAITLAAGAVRQQYYYSPLHDPPPSKRSFAETSCSLRESLALCCSPLTTNCSQDLAVPTLRAWQKGDYAKQ